MSSERPRSLADDLRSRTDADLAVLLDARPDLLNPVPADVAALAARASSRPSVQRALDGLDLFTLQVLDVLCVLPEPAPVDDATALLGVDATAATTALHRMALVYGDAVAPVVVRTVREVVGSPAGLGPPAEQLLAGYGPARLERLAGDLGVPTVGDPAEQARRLAEVFADPARLEALLADAGPESRDALAGLVWGPPTGRVDKARRDVDVATAASPVDRLLARGLLVGTTSESVVLPREVALHLRGGRVHREVQPDPPAPEVRVHDRAEVDRVAGAAAFTAVRLVEDLLELWADEPPKALRAGGLGVRERARARTALDVPDEVLSLLTEVSAAAGLLAVGGDLEDLWLPSPAYDAWLQAEPADRWADLVEAWSATTRVASLAGQPDERGRATAPLGPDLDRTSAPALRRAALNELAALAPGSAAAPEAVLARLRWHAPRRGGRLRDVIVTSALAEAETLGLTGRGALAGPARELLAGERAAAVAAMTALMPEPLDAVLLQADLTAVAPGPLRSDLAARLRLAADVESTGGATVYRFGAASVRRALDAGWTAADLLDLLGRHSRTPVPQPLAYLVEDVARRHGRIRVGTASSYVRCDDESLVAEVLADRRAATLRLRRLAPTVLASPSPPDVVLDRLRAMGHAPAAEGEGGDVLVRRADGRRSAVRRPAPRPVRQAPRPTPALLAAAVRAVRAGDRALTAVRRPAAGSERTAAGAGDGPVRLPRTPTADILAIVGEAIRARTPLWIGYVNAEGTATQRVVDPISLDGGYVSAYDHLRDEVRTFAVHRITGVSEVDEPPT